MDIIRKRNQHNTGDNLRLHLNECITPTWKNFQHYPDLEKYYKEFENILGHKLFFTEGISGAVKEIMSILKPRTAEWQGTWALYDIFKKLYSSDNGPAVMFCLYPETDIDSVVKDYDHVIIDDAYQYFHARDWTPFLKYKNVTIMRTFSKAFGLAGLRIGYIAGELVDLLDMHRGGYEANSFALERALFHLKNENQVKQYASEVKRVRVHMLDKYSDMRWDGYSNSLYTKRIDIHQKMLDNNILVKQFACEARITLAPMSHMKEVFNILDE